MLADDLKDVAFVEPSPREEVLDRRLAAIDPADVLKGPTYAPPLLGTGDHEKLHVLRRAIEFRQQRNDVRHSPAGTQRHAIDKHLGFHG